MTNIDGPDYAKANTGKYSADEAGKVSSITDNVRRKSAQGGT